MIQATARETEARNDIVELEVRELFNDLGRGQDGREQVEHIDHANAQCRE